MVDGQNSWSMQFCVRRVVNTLFWGDSENAGFALTCADAVVALGRFLLGGAFDEVANRNRMVVSGY